MGSTSKLRDGEDRVGIGNVFGADMIKLGFVVGANFETRAILSYGCEVSLNWQKVEDKLKRVAMGFSFIDVINKELDGKEATGTIEIEVPATNTYAEELW
ncbi:hypothetical protein V6N13_140052 [Hibiscus sabdariffa]